MKSLFVWIFVWLKLIKIYNYFNKKQKFFTTFNMNFFSNTKQKIMRNFQTIGKVSTIKI